MSSTNLTSSSASTSNPEFKKYSSQMEKIVLSFDAVVEWADMIAFLTRLQKLLQTYQHFNAIPKKMVLSKRLSQCLNPALPPRVHTKVLHVYKSIHSLTTDIFQNQGAALENDLNIWSMGLFPFTIHASMAVRPVLIDLYNEFYVSLGRSVLVCMKGFVLAILPFFEEESNEFFEPVVFNFILGKMYQFIIGNRY